jgi:hypothetical protein
LVLFFTEAKPPEGYGSFQPLAKPAHFIVEQSDTSGAGNILAKSEVHEFAEFNPIEFAWLETDVNDLPAVCQEPCGLGSVLT